jgi:hypothetical protein
MLQIHLKFLADLRSYAVNQFLADLLSRGPQLRLVALPHGRGHLGWIERRKGGLLARGGRPWVHLFAIRP